MESRDHERPITAVKIGQTHTPGPWIVERSANRIWVGYPKAWAPKVSEVVCSFEIGPGFTDKANARNEADARLISASPELLEALKLAERMLVIAITASLSGFGHDETLAIVAENVGLIQIRAAIAKAESQS